MIASLAVMLAVVHLPLTPEPAAVGWHVAERSTIDVSSIQFSEDRTPGVPVTTFEDPESDRDEPDGEANLDAEAGEETASTHSEPRHITGLRVVETAPQMPRIVGGLGAFYVHIDYPEEAVEQQIEGRLVLNFTVNTDGETEDIRVSESLHPLCDSAAVAALRKTRFIPGRSNGELVPLRMRLPVRFRLVSSQTTSSR